MMNLKFTPKEARDKWNQKSSQVQVITKDFLTLTLGVDRRYLRVQDGLDSTQFNIASPSLLDR